MRVQMAFHERLTQAADAKDFAGNFARMFCRRLSSTSDIPAAPGNGVSNIGDQTVEF